MLPAVLSRLPLNNAINAANPPFINAKVKPHPKTVP